MDVTKREKIIAILKNERVTEIRRKELVNRYFEFTYFLHILLRRPANLEPSTTFYVFETKWNREGLHVNESVSFSFSFFFLLLLIVVGFVLSKQGPSVSMQVFVFLNTLASYFDWLNAFDLSILTYFGFESVGKTVLQRKHFVFPFAPDSTSDS